MFNLPRDRSEDQIYLDTLPGCTIYAPKDEPEDLYVKYTSPDGENGKGGKNRAGSASSGSALGLNQVLAARFRDTFFGFKTNDTVDSYEPLYLPFRKFLAIPREDMTPAELEAIPFVAWLCERFHREYARVTRLRAEGMIDGAKSYFLYEPGKPYLYHSSLHDTWQIGILRAVTPVYVFGMHLGNRFVMRSATYGVMPDLDDDTYEDGLTDGDTGGTIQDLSLRKGPSYGVGEVQAAIHTGTATVEASKFPFRTPTADDVERLATRGRAYLELVQNKAMAAYKGRFMGSKSVMPHDGRVILDSVAIPEFEPSALKYCGGGGATLDVEREWKHGDLVPAEAAIFGAQLAFSLQARRWGGVRIEDLVPVQFREGALGRVAMDQRPKDLVRALVSSDKEARFRDLVDQKASATIILLVGVVGSGKTILVQSVAEHLKRPLYSIDLNTMDLDDIEDELTTTLKLTRRWNAVVLIDEADALLRNRQTCEPEEARRVATFLRVLEEHEGTIFLTSNHWGDIDVAIRSRVSLTVRYEAPGTSLRRQIWTSLLEGLPDRPTLDLDIEELASWPINGREIKHAIKMALVLAEDQVAAGTRLSTELLTSIMVQAYGPKWRLRAGELMARVQFWK